MLDNYFSLFEIKPSLEIDQEFLRQQYFALQQKFHPDKNKDGAEQSAKLNLAYSTLKDKFRRLEYVVKTMTPNNLKAGQALLMEVMELREQHEQNPELVEKQVKAEIEQLFEQAGLAFKANKLDDVATKFTKIKYLQNVIANT